MSDPVSICNLALGQLGAYRISSIENPQTDTEELCALYYPVVRDLLLESRDWSFLIKRVTLDTPNLPAPDWGFSQAFLLPTDVYRVIDVQRTTDTDPYATNYLNWALEGKRIVCDMDQVYVRYITRDVFETSYSQQFVMAFAMNLAAYMCIQITENRSLKVDLMQMAQAALEEAAALDGMQGRHEQIRANTLIDARNNGTGRIW